ncbi:MAG: hypothetical protein WCF33_24960 [Pseudonocardiaceae bacterium]
MASFVIQPFGPDELQEFSAAWFRAQDPMTAPERAAEFAHQVQDGQLRELVRNPLLATIAAIAYTREPSIRLPNNRMDLYGLFMKHLFDETISGRDVVGELRYALRGEPARLQLIERIVEDKISIISHLAVARIQTETPLFDTAKKYAEEKYEIDTNIGEMWIEDMREVLVSTGVFVRAEDNLRFLHQSLAEYLAAKNWRLRLTRASQVSIFG